jgi:type 1 glutamine amidotransferase
MKKYFGLMLLAIIMISGANAQQNKKIKLNGKSILIFTKNGKGYVHENIAASITALQKIGNQLKFNVDTTTNASIFTEESLKKYDAVIFSNTNNDVFDTEPQKIAFMRYIQAGGGFMGIHSAAGTERNWKWFKLMLGATFLRHPPYQPFTVHVLNKEHPATKNLAAKWDTKDECYYFKEFNPSIKILLFSDISTIVENNEAPSTDSTVRPKYIKPDVFGNRYPAAWCNEFDGGKIWYTALGHNKEDYANSNYLAHLLEGLKWVTAKGKLNYKKAYSNSSVTDELKQF